MAPIDVRNADNGRFIDGRVGVQDRLDFSRGDILTATNDDVILAANQVDIAVFVDIAHVAGMQPAVFVQQGGGRAFLIGVALHHARGANDHLTDLVGRQLFIVVIKDLDFHIRQRFTDRGQALQVALDFFRRAVQLMIVRSKDGQGRVGFGLAKGIHKTGRVREHINGFTNDGEGHGRAAIGDVL